MTSRTYQDSLKNKPVQDERQFNNFKIEKANLNKTCDFGKLKGKCLEFNLKHMNGRFSIISDIYHESKKGH